jgi:hypothetical protein
MADASPSLPNRSVQCRMSFRHWCLQGNSRVIPLRGPNSAVRYTSKTPCLKVVACSYTTLEFITLSAAAILLWDCSPCVRGDKRRLHQVAGEQTAVHGGPRLLRAGFIGKLNVGLRGRQKAQGVGQRYNWVDDVCCVVKAGRSPRVTALAAI